MKLLIFIGGKLWYKYLNEMCYVEKHGVFHSSGT